MNTGNSDTAVLREGFYELTGSNPDAPDMVYSGHIQIEKKGGQYALRWFIGKTQSQAGVAILEGNVLSVGYMDSSGGDFGVVSFRIISPSRLEGKWCSLGNPMAYGRETLEYLGETLEGIGQHRVN